MKKVDSANIVQDIELVATIKENVNKRESDKAFSVLFDKYRTHMTFLMKTRVTDSTELEDLVMEAFEKAYKNIGDFNEASGAFSTWLYKIFNNLFIDYLRKKKENLISLSELVHVRENGEETPFTLATNDKNVVEIIETNDKRVAVRAAIKNMKNEFHRELIDMRFFKDMSYDDMAERTGKPLVAIKVGLNRAKAEFRKEIGNNEIFL